MNSSRQSSRTRSTRAEIRKQNSTAAASLPSSTSTNESLKPPATVSLKNLTCPQNSTTCSNNVEAESASLNVSVDAANNVKQKPATRGRGRKVLADRKQNNSV